MAPERNPLAQDDTPAFIVHLLDNRLTLLVARICLTLPFLAAGCYKLIAWQPGEAEMLHSGLHPAWLYNLATLITELGGSALIILNRITWLGAGALGVFTVLATFLGHRFWEFDGPDRISQLNSFLEHTSISAAFILVVVASLRARATPATATQAISVPSGYDAERQIL